MYSLELFICTNYWTGEQSQVEALNEDEAIEIFKDETGASVVQCERIA